jgi:hypothetical protein
VSTGDVAVPKLFSTDWPQSHLLNYGFAQGPPNGRLNCKADGSIGKVGVDWDCDFDEVDVKVVLI